MILDADVLIDLLRESPQAETWLRGLEALPAVSGMAALEVVYGSRNAASPPETRYRVIFGGLTKADPPRAPVGRVATTQKS
jgi:predicted nucleic acid-binding protein